MDFYIRTFECKGWGASGHPDNYSDNRAIYIWSETLEKLRVMAYSVPIPSSHQITWSLQYNSAYLPNPAVSLPTPLSYEPASNVTYIAQYPDDGSALPTIKYSTNTFPLPVGYRRLNWASRGWTTGVQATFEEQLCDMFYSITQNYPANIGSLGKIEDKMNLYLFRLYLDDLGYWEEIPAFQKGNDPAYDRIYTANIVI